MRRPSAFVIAMATGTIGVTVLTLWLSRDGSPQRVSADQTVSLSAPVKVAPALMAPLASELQPSVETPESVAANHDEQIDEIADTFAANPALIDALEDERDLDARTRAEAQQIVEAATAPPAP